VSVAPLKGSANRDRSADLPGGPGCTRAMLGKATAVLCMMRYLGQEDVRALDDGPAKWIAANGNEGERAFAGEPCCLPSMGAC